jgi:hypothetical protein
LFLCGAPAAAAELIAVVEPARRASRKELHTTTIRNEHAYYCCAAQCLASQAPTTHAASEGAAAGAGAEAAAEASAAAVPLLVCGDSHALPAAWQAVGGRRLEPKLVTGLKHWHLRPGSDFYPKVCPKVAPAACSRLYPALPLALSLFLFALSSRNWQVNFERCVAALPDACDVVFIFGEIDCREGILVAIEKDR